MLKYPFRMKRFRVVEDKPSDCTEKRFWSITNLKIPVVIYELSFRTAVGPGESTLINCY